MANEQTGLDVVIRAILESKGFDQLQDKLKAAREGGKEAAAGVAEFSGAINDLGGKLLAATGITLGLAESVVFLKESFLAAVEASRVLDQMAAANEMFAGATKESTEANHAWLESLEAASGRAKEEIVPAYLRFVEVTGDVEKAQRLAQVAVGASVAGFGELGQITQALTRYWVSGEAGTKGFGLAIKKLNDEGITGDAVFQKLFERFGQGGANIQNLGVQVDRAKVAWENTKEAIGSLTTGLVSGLAPALKLVSEGIGGAIAFFNYLLVPVKVLGTALGQVGAALYHLVTGQFKLAADDMKDLWTKTAKIGEDAVQFNVDVMKKIDAAWNEHGENVKKGAEVLTGAHQKEGAELDALRKKYQILADNAVQLGMEEVQARLAVLKVYQQMANDPAVAKFPDLQAEANKRLVAAVNSLGQSVAKEAEDAVHAEERKRKAIQETNDQWLAGEKKRIDAERKGVDESVKLEIAKYKALERGDIDYLQQYQAFLQQQLILYKGTAEEKARLDRELATTTIRLEQVKQDAYLATAGAAVAFASAAFGQNKAVMIAEGILNAYAAYARAQKDYGYPYSLIIGGLAFATTMAQVAAMEPVEPNTSTKGFDDPGNDFAAMVGGRKWARDMILMYGQGASAGFSEGMRGGGSSTVNNSSIRHGDRHVHVTLNAGMGTDRTALIQFVKRDLVPVLNRIDRQRDIQ